MQRASSRRKGWTAVRLLTPQVVPAWNRLRGQHCNPQAGKQEVSRLPPAGDTCYLELLAQC
jgi:hypothetical protein